MREIGRVPQESSAQDILALIKRRVRRHAPLLIVLCGSSHSGKTTFARRLGSRFTVISSDKIREQLGTCFKRSEDRVWKIFESTKCKALKEGRDVILDACHMSRRARWHGLQGTNSRHRKICVVFDVPLRVIQDRCLKVKRMPITEVRRIWKDFEKHKPTPEELRLEGFDGVCFVKAGELKGNKGRLTPTA